MQLTLSTLLDCPLEQAVAHVRTPRLLEHVSHPILHFAPVESSAQPPLAPHEALTEGTHWVALRLFGWLPLGRQAIVVSYPPCTNGFALRDNGYSALIRRWDHHITLMPEGAKTRYTDRITIEAGLLTLPVWLFAQVLYRHRQRRWRALVRSGFVY